MRSPCLRLLSACLLLGWISPLVAYAWEGKQDNKPVAELQLMTPGELCVEAASTIPYAAALGPSNPSLAVDADNYIETIGRVIRARQGGKEPLWKSKAIIAIGKHDGMQSGKLIETECGPLLINEGKQAARREATKKHNLGQ